MNVRLAFAVAAHLEPEILLVDEVLAVGDVGFQRKCIGKMSDVAGEGRTVLFVSHNMAVIQSLCKRGILLEKERSPSTRRSTKPSPPTCARWSRMLPSISASARTEAAGTRCG